MGFNASDAVPKLEWDFTEYVPDAKGCAPEPTNEEIAEFVTEWRNHTETIRRLALSRIEAEHTKLANQTKEERQEFLERWAHMSWEEGLETLRTEIVDLQTESGMDFQKMAESHARHSAGLIAKVFHNSPTVDQMMALPGRVRSVFFGWVVGQLNDPESWSVATSS